MAITTECSCGEKHTFDSENLKKLQLKDSPEYIECSECPVCSPEFFDTPEDHEDEAYKDEGDIEKLLKDDDFEDIGELEDDLEEDEY
jgi:hypothetical protein